MPNITIVQPGETRKRFHRRPNFPIAGTMRPFGLYPIMIHPVLPGETLKSGKARWSVISQPLVNPLSGAWLESWFFYVKLTDIDRDLGEMFISDSMSTSGYTLGTGRRQLFTGTGGINWVFLCLDKIRSAYFKNEGESDEDMASPDGTIPKMKINNKSWYQNIMLEPAEVALDTTGERDFREQMSAYDMVTQMQMTELSYESYLEQYGVSSMRTGLGEPEILRFSRSWTKPTNHVDPSSGTPSSAWVWNDEMVLEKDKRFNEPGFIIMLGGVRPKMMNGMLVNTLCQNMWGFSDWYPAYNLTDPQAGIKRIGTDDDVFLSTINAAEGEVQCLYDQRDLLSHGETFVNDIVNNPYPHPFSTGHSLVAAASPQDQRGEYATHDDIDNLFVGSAESAVRCQYEGIVGLTIAGHVTDTTL